jgi:hypothetical protein
LNAIPSAGNHVIVGQHVAMRRNHKSAAGADFNVVHVDGSLDTCFLDFGVDAADKANEDRRVGGRFGALRVGRACHQKEGHRKCRHQFQ